MAGYSETPLLKKLGIKPSSVMYVSGAPGSYFDDLGALPEGVRLKTKLSGEFDFIHVFLKSRSLFQKQFSIASKCLKQDGMIWVSWPKKSSKVETDLDENVIREYGLNVGLVDVKVCAVDDVWSGLKFVIPLKDRK